MTNNEIDPMDEYYGNKEELARKYATMRSLAAAVRKFARENPVPTAPAQRKALVDLTVAQGSKNDQSPKAKFVAKNGRHARPSKVGRTRLFKAAKTKATTPFRRTAKTKK